MNLILIISLTALIVVVQGQKPSKDQLETALNMMITQLKGGVTEIDKALAEKKTDPAHADMYKQMRTHLVDLTNQKQVILDQLKKDGNTETAMQNMKKVLTDFAQTMKKFHQEHGDKIKG